MNDEEFQQFGKYLLLKPIGQGGMGEIYLAYDTETGMLVALKRTLANGDRGLVKRFIDEQRISTRLRHPNLLRVHETGQIDQTLYLSMEWIFGRTLWDVSRALEEDFRRMDPIMACTIVRRVCRALEYAHGIGNLSFIHRDVSLANIMLSYDGRVRLLDYGVAWSTLKQTQTATHAFVGNPIFSSPEQWNHQTVNTRTDIYCLGAVLWSLISGRWPRDPYQGDGKISLIKPLGKELLGEDEVIDRFIERATAEDPSERFQSAAQFGDLLDRYLLGRASVTRFGISEFLERLFRGEREKVEEEVAELVAWAEIQNAHSPIVESPAELRKNRNMRVAGVTLLLMSFVIFSFGFGLHVGSTQILPPAISKDKTIRENPFITPPQMRVAALPSISPVGEGVRLPASVEETQKPRGQQVEHSIANQPGRLSKIKPDTSQLLEAAEAAYEAGQYAAAKRIASTAIGKGATIAGKLLRAKAALKLGEVVLAQKDYLAVIALEKDNHEAQSALVYLQKNQ